jgi:hypothetical protein
LEKTKNLFEKLASDGNNSIEVLKWLAKRGNPEAYEAWRIKNTPMPHCLLPFPVKFPKPEPEPEPLRLDVFLRSENDVVKHIAPFLKKTIKFCNKIWYVCREDNIWMETTNPPLSTIITHVQNQLVKARAKYETAFASALEKTTDTDVRKQMEESVCKRWKDTTRRIVPHLKQDFPTI